MIRRVCLTLFFILGASPAFSSHDNYDQDKKKSKPYQTGNVYVMENDPNGNRVVVYARLSNGKLKKKGKVSTDGLGAGDNAEADPLGSQDSMYISKNGRYLYVVNAGSDEISVFYLDGKGYPKLVQVIYSNGDFPVSLESDGKVLYVLNSGSNGSISGFKMSSKTGELELLENSYRELGTGQVGAPVGAERNVAPGDIAFDTLQRRLLIVHGRGVELGEGRLLAFTVDDAGLPSHDYEELTAQGRLPFSVDFTRHGTALVADALGPVAGEPGPGIGGSLSSYNFTQGAALESVNIVGNGEIETCWVKVAHKSNLAFTTSTGGGAISAYRVSRNGVIKLLDPIAAELSLPIDFDLTNNDKFLYAVSADTGNVVGYRVSYKGTLKKIGEFGGLPTFANDGFAPQGIAVR